MSHFVITYAGAVTQKSIKVRRTESKQDAAAILTDENDQQTSALIVSEPLDVSGSKPFMISLYNALAREGDAQLSPTGFNTRTTGQDRIFERLHQYYGNLPASPAPELTAPSSEVAKPGETPHEENNDMAAKKKATVKKVKKAKVAGDKKPRDRKPSGKGKPVRRASSLGKILELAIEGAHTKEQIAKKVDLRPDQVMHRIGQVMRINNGIEHTVNKDGVIKVSLPDGFNKNTIFKDKAE